MKKFLSLVFLSIFLYGYQVSNTIDKEMQKKLQIDKDKIYIVDFFASWCSSCKKELPELAKLNNSIDKNKIKIIGVDVDTDIKDGRKFQKELRQNGSLNFTVIDDPKSIIVKKFNPIGMPTLFIIKQNKIVDIIIGAKDDIDQLVLKKLKEVR